MSQGLGPAGGIQEIGTAQKEQKAVQEAQTRQRADREFANGKLYSVEKGDRSFTLAGRQRHRGYCKRQRRR